MKILLALIISLNTYAGLPPTTLKGQDQNKMTTFNTVVPYSQAISQGGVTSYLDTGNENMLFNGNFEGQASGGVGAAWTLVAGTGTITTTSGEFSSGKQAQKVVLSAQVLNLSQSVTPTSGMQSQAVVGILYKVPSGFTGFQVCSLINGAEKDCVPTANLILDNLYHSIEIPVVLVSGQSVGIKVKTTASATGTVFFDAAYIKQGLGLAPVNLVETDSLTSNNASNGSLTDVVTEVQFSSVTVSSANVVSVVQDGANTRTKFVALKDCVVNVSYNTPAAISEYVVIYKNGVEASRGSASYVSTRNIVGSASLSLLAGEYITVGVSSGGSSAAAAYTFTMTAQTIQKSNVYQSTNVGVEAIEALTSTSTYGSTNTGVPVLNITRNTNLGILRVDSSAANGTSFTVLKEANVTMSASGTINGNGSSMSLTKNATILTAGSFVSGIFFAKDSAFTNAPIFQVTGSIRVSPGDVLRIQGDGGMPINVATITATPVSSYMVGSFAGVPTTGYAGNVDNIIISYGTTNATTVCSASPCSYLDQIGNGVTSITRSATGTYAINTTKTYAKLKCVGGYSNSTQAGLTPSQTSSMSCTACNSLVFATGNTVALFDSFGTIDCKGSY